MLSLIICSRTPRISKELEKNIAETIGCEYELVVIDNSKNKYSIFSAYNEGVRRAQGDNLCFMHDDISFKTTDWGTKVEKMLEDESIGIVGVIGSYIMTKDYGYWDMMAPYITGFVMGEKDGVVANDGDAYNDYTGGEGNVVILDGMWLCCSKRIFDKICFDEQTYMGFHMYDMDICMQSLVAGYKNMIVRDIVMQHYCQPKYDRIFIENIEKFHKKWMEYLPIHRSVSLSPRTLKKLDSDVKRLFGSIAANVSLSESAAYRTGCILLKPIYFLKKMINKLYK